MVVWFEIIAVVVVGTGVVVVGTGVVASMVVWFEIIVVVVVGNSVVVNSHDEQFALFGQSHTFMLSLKCNPAGQDL